jgi:diguanylate cyclase (GGDEF)-like protein
MDKDDILNYERKLRLLNGMSMLIQSCNKEKELFDVLYWYLPNLYPDTSGGIFLRNENDGKMDEVFSWGSSECAEISCIPDAKLCPAIKKGRPVDILKPDNHKLSPNCSIRAYCVPLIDALSTFGILKIESKEINTDKHQRGLGFISAEFIALAVSNLRMKNRLREISLVDPLTGLHNRRYLDDALKTEIAKAKQSGSNLGVIMIDLDYFKKLNDSKGHDAGDEVLKAVSYELKKNVRKSDVVCRFGGEEFIVLICGGEYKEFLSRTESLREVISRVSIIHKGIEIGSVTASFGVASLPEHGLDAESILKAADKALYTAKSMGRNKIVGISEIGFFNKESIF